MKKKESKIREIIEKHAHTLSIDCGKIEIDNVIIAIDFNKLEKELEEYMKTLWTQVGYEWDGEKFIKYESRTP